MRRSILKCLVIVSWVVVSICGYCQTTPAADGSPAPIQPYELKGDRLGMSLAEFKARHYRKISKKKHAPFCSDEGAQHVPMGGPHFVNCALEEPLDFLAYPRDRLPSYLTVANLLPYTYWFRFYDGQLYEIEVTFVALEDPEDLMGDYQHLYNALITTYGPPLKAEKRIRKNRYHEGFEIILPTWRNGVSTRELQWEGKVMTLDLRHDELYRRARQTFYPNTPDL
jgi:hypothetical protein